MTEAQIHELLEHGRFQRIPLDGELVETHISWVILLRNHVLKIKKPIQYSFLDFSTVAKRRHFCEREVELNRRLTKAVYIDVLPIKEEKEGLFVGKERGKLLDHAVLMKRLRTSKKMDVVMRNGKLKKPHIAELAHKIADFHRTAEKILEPFRLEEAREEFDDIGKVSNFIRDTAGKEFSRIITDSIGHSDKFLERHEDHIKERIRLGFQRDVHGDLHSRNIFLYRDPVIFDCIEFNDKFRQIDLLKELAFFCMDLDAFGYDLQGTLFMKIYLDRFPCMDSDEDWALFRYYKAYRANVRAKVNALRAQQAEGDTRGEFIEEVVRYVRLMEGYMKEVEA